MTKVVIQASGGVESTTMLAHAIRMHGRDNVFPIAFNTDSVFYHTRDRVAIKRALSNQQMYHKLHTATLPQVDLLEHNRDGEFADVGFIPGYKMLFNVTAMAWAQRMGASEVWIGNMADNVYPDESPAFIKGVEDVYNATYTAPYKLERIKFVEPFAGMTKADVIAMGLGMGVDLYDTVSCGEERLAGGYNCGLCPWCLKRRAGFADSGYEDRTFYAHVPESHKYAGIDSAQAMGIVNTQTALAFKAADGAPHG